MGVCITKSKAEKSIDPLVPRISVKAKSVSTPRFLTICKPPMSLLRPPSAHADSTGDGSPTKPGPDHRNNKVGSLTCRLTGTLSISKQREFEDKVVEKSGDDLPEGYLKNRGVAAVCKKGLKPEVQNQDDFCVVVQQGILILGVFDGHGPSGHQVSAYVSVALPAALSSHEAFKTNPIDCFEPSFEHIQTEMRNRYKEGKRSFDCVLSGTTATIAIVGDEAYWVGHVGDSRAVLSKLDPATGTRTVVQITTDHRPSLPEERERIEELGGEVKVLSNDQAHRIFLPGKDYPGLAMSRAIGDIIAEQVGVISIPDVFASRVEPEDEFLLICSDGVWEFVSNDEAVAAVAALGKAGVGEAAEAVAKLAWQGWIHNEEEVVDDITVVIAYLH